MANSITKFAMTTAQQGAQRQIVCQALTKIFFYNPMKKVLHVLGVNLTKQTFAKGVSKVVPAIGGVISGDITYASFKPDAERLRRYLRVLPLSGIDAAAYPDVAAIRADLKENERAEAIEQAKETGAAAIQAAGNTLATGAAAAGTAISDAAASAGVAAAETAKAAGKAAGEALGGLLGALKRGSKDELS